ncbi:hypothetical protein Sjap_014147 [Stephania japonica]|uniref:Leucine-rich repeat-containing N-terminal plant-type domain-containing protein n=1 Tax=Stephania japonica TaxID=461633 RepID=A0AAP0J0K4_9MAGN
MMRFNVMFSSCVIIYALCFLLVCSPSWAVEGQCLDEQRHLLLHFKHNLSFYSSSESESGVPVWLSSWDLNTDCCRSWEGVECNQIGEVIGLDLSNKSIVGSTDGLASLFHLSHLQGLNLGYNHFNSAIPSGFDRLPYLTHLNLSNSGFVGQIPIGISRLARLVSLDLSSFDDYALKLESPNLRMLVGNLSELRELGLDFVNISSDKERNEWAQIFSSSLPKLQVLSLSSCSLSGPFDPSLSKLRSLSELWLAQNNFSAEIPEFFGSFSNLTVLHLTNCGLQGKFPQNIFKLPKLKHLHLSLNPMLKGSLPEFPQYNSLQFLILSSSSFSGELPSSIGNLKYLSKLDLFNCHFNGSIPPTVTNLSQLLYLDLSSNSFTGPIPSLSLSKNLTLIDLSNNLLSGLIPHFDPGDFKNLVNLYLQNNSLNGSIPSSLFTLPSLKKLDLSLNQISGSLGEFPVDSLLQLETLDLSSNKLGGAVPLSIFNITSLKVVALSSNQFNGTLEFRKFEALNNISNLDLSGNLLSVSASGVNSALLPQLITLKLSSCNLKVVPQFLRNQSKLIYLDLSNNNIGGNIPSWMENIGDGSINYLNLSCNSLENPERPFSNGSFRELSVLDLHSNRFQGPIPILPPSASFLDYSKNNLSIIPISIGSSLSTAIFLSLASNNIHGNLPGSLCQAAGNIQVLDLSNNSFSGAIPSCPGGIGGPLRVINLRRNHLSGTMNAVFREDCALRTIDLSENRFEGEVSRSLGNCAKLEVLNIGNNQFSGTFPHWLGTLSQLRVLVLRSNHFHGPIGIPQLNYTFSMLQIFDISYNKFRGNVPVAYFSSWKSMRNDEDETELMAKHQILKYSFFEFSSFYYQDEVTVTSKGLEMELGKILTIFTSLDLSNNEFEGAIPEEIGNLKALHVMNLSRNAFTGPIPSSIGNLKQLESLDLSRNQLSGMIPSELTGLTFLSVLNLSYNNLEGKIPLGRQFDTFEESSYKGNNGLCGRPLSKNCTAVVDQHTHGNRADDDHKDGLCEALKFLFSDCTDNKSEFKWQLIVTALGFGVGNGIACWSVLVFYGFCSKRKSRRHRRNRHPRNRL